jgi:hypothetical protein
MSLPRILLLLTVLTCIGLSTVAGGCVAGRMRENQSSPSTTVQPSSPVPGNSDVSASTCTALGGDMCTAGEECRGSWLTASDSFTCCSQACSATNSSETLTIEPFGTLEENEDLGSVV